jgi:hypothetical protein
VPCDVAAGETILPIADAVMFTATGGQAIAGTTADGAQSQILTYTGVQLGGGGSLVGPGAAPSVAPSLALATGTELGIGAYQYAYTDVTASGESLPSPLGTITTGTTAAPTSTPTPASPSASGNVDAGSVDYVATFVTSAGETTAGPTSSSATTVAGLTAPTVLQVNTMNGFGSSGGSIDISNFKYSVSFLNVTGETLATQQTGSGSLAAGQTKIDLFSIPTGGAGTTGRKIYRSDLPAGPGTFDTPRLVIFINDNTTTNATDSTATGSRGAVAPSTDTTPRATVALSAIPTGDSTVTGRKLYRRFNGTGTFKLATTLNDNTTTTYTDTTANASLGADAPSSNTAIARRVSVAGIAVGATGTTSRKVYRTAVGASQLKLLTTLADNTTTTFADATADGSLGANAPTSDTSALAQPSGQVLAGATSLPTASAGPFNASIGGWALLSGGQAVRYSGISSNTLTGIPASGPGAITTTVLYGSQVLPAPALTGINQWNGLSRAMAKGSKVNIWVQRDDLAAQAALGALELDDDGVPTDGIREYTISDERSTEATMIGLCDADLAIFSRPIVSAVYYTRDTKSKSGRTVSIDLFAGGLFDPAVFDSAVFDVYDPGAKAGDFTIQHVELSFDGPALNPLYAVTATSVAFTLNDLLRRVALTS